MTRFIEESNKIEGIYRAPTSTEIAEYKRFMDLDSVSIADLEIFVMVYQPNARLRVKFGQNVHVGNHFPPPGGPEIVERLDYLLLNCERSYEAAYHTHIEFETLHPFTDGNGRVGRMLWLWQMRRATLGFLHSFYYQTLQFTR